jgi:hypothetical protein
VRYEEAQQVAAAATRRLYDSCIPNMPPMAFHAALQQRYDLVLKTVLETSDIEYSQQDEESIGGDEPAAQLPEQTVGGADVIICNGFTYLGTTAVMNSSPATH